MGSIAAMTQSLSTFLTFQGGTATSALNLYRDVFDDFELIEINYYGADGPGPEGTVISARFRIGGANLGCADSPIAHEWGFTPAISIWIDCDSHEEIERGFLRLADGGEVFMPLDDYGFSSRFGWVSDPYGVTWQLNLP